MQNKNESIESMRAQVAQGFCPANASVAILRDFDAPKARSLRERALQLSDEERTQLLQQLRDLNN